MSSRLPPVFPMPSAVRWGDDIYGLFQDIDILGVIQRMRWIPPGSFYMGSPEKERVRDDDEYFQLVDIEKGFWLADTAVTQTLWQSVLKVNPSEFIGAEHPVESVNWLDCQEFTTELNKACEGLVWRLPSEAEWEYACRAGTASAFNFGESITLEHANYDGMFDWEGEDSSTDMSGRAPEKSTVKVKRFSLNPWGLYQMHGNVWEWCASCWQDKATGQQVDMSMNDTVGENDHMVLRGGSWLNYGRRCRSEYRDHAPAVFRRDAIGLRLALGPELK